MKTEILKLVKNTNLNKKDLIDIRELIDDKLTSVYSIDDKFNNLKRVGKWISSAGDLMEAYMRYNETERYRTVYFTEIIDRLSWGKGYVRLVLKFFLEMDYGVPTINKILNTDYKLDEDEDYEVEDLLKCITDEQLKNEILIEELEKFIKQVAIEENCVGTVCDW